MFAYNGGRLQAACRLLEEKYSEQDVTIGLSLAGALTPAGLGVQAIIPLMNHGFVDWIVSTGANMYHDLHFAFDLPLHQGSHNVDDKDLRAQGVTRIYDVLLDYQKVLMATDWDLREFLLRPEFQQEMSTQVFYHHLGELANQVEEVKYKDKETKEVSILAAAYRNGIPVFTSSPGDSTIGMNIAGLELIADALNLGERFKLRINPSRDVNESTAIVFNAKVCEKKKTGVILIGGGSPKNFMLQTEPQIQEVLGIPEVGQDYDINVTDARPDTGGLSGAPPSEAVSWGKINADKLEESVVVYADATIVLPLMVQYAIDTTQPKQLKRLYERREELYEKIKQASIKHHPHVRKLEELMRALLPTRRND
jgi:deoxyhypusine synthase